MDYQKLTQETENLNCPISVQETEVVDLKTPGPDNFSGEFYQTLKQEIILILHKFFQTIKKERTFSNSLCKARICLKKKKQNTHTHTHTHTHTLNFVISDGNCGIPLHSVLPPKLAKAYVLRESKVRVLPVNPKHLQLLITWDLKRRDSSMGREHLISHLSWFRLVWRDRVARSKFRQMQRVWGTLGA